MTLLPWQAPLAAQVRERLAAGRLGHALLVAGPEGWGETAFANWLALYLLGVEHAADAAAVAHPDLRWLAPDGAVIKVDAVRELEDFAHGTPQAGSRKVAVLTHAHYLNVNAANALLKTLEEPPPGTHLLLASCHPGRLLPTVRSRCQTLSIRPDPAAAERWLAEQVNADDLALRLFEHGGAPVAVAEGVEAGETPLEKLLEAAPRESGAAVVKALMEPSLAGALGRWYRYVLAMAAGSRTVRGFERATPRGLMAFADELTWARRQLLTSNSANARLLAERLVARWKRLA
ncbi:MAG: hypothetical protein ACODAC_02405 [Pseudomonadota bacterium]